MNRTMIGLAGAAALAAGVIACRDAAVSPREATPAAPAFQLEGKGPSHLHFVSNGDRGSADWGASDASGSVSGSLYVSRGNWADPPTTFLEYDLTRCDASHNCTWEGGYGLIPNGDLTGSGAGGLHLETNTAGIPDFYNSGAGGVIVADWRRSSAWVETNKGTHTIKTPAYTARNRESWVATSATVVGQMLGVVIGPGYAELGTNHAVTIDIER